MMSEANTPAPAHAHAPDRSKEANVQRSTSNAERRNHNREAVRVDMWDQEVGTPGTVGHAIRSYTTQWGLPDMACGHNFSQLIEKSDGRIVCGACGK
jgi:hypothetical protein